MNTLQLFTLQNFKGESVTLDSDNPDLQGFLQKAQSLKVHGEPWIVFSHVNYNYKGTFKPFTAGDYPTIPGWENKISSARLVSGGFYPPKITLYDELYYGGKAAPLVKETDSLKINFSNGMASSQKDVNGAWILYSKEFFKGNQMVTVAGDDIPDYSAYGFGDKVGSLRPITG